MSAGKGRTGMEAADAKISLKKLEQNIIHMHRGVEILLIVKGSIQLELEGALYSLESDDVVLINHQELHAIRSASDNVVLQLRLSQEYLERECRELCGVVFACNSTGSTEEDSANYFEVKRILVRMLLTYAQKNEGYTLEYKGLLYQLFYHLKLHFQTEGSGFSMVHREEKTASIADIVSYINDNYHRSISLKEAAAQAFMSPAYFSKYFKTKLGVRFLDYLTRVRMEHAVSDLLNTDQSILSVSLNNGFASAKSFATAFQRTFNQTPSEYRRSHYRSREKVNEEESQQELDAGMSGDMKELRFYIRRHSLEPENRAEWGGKTELALGEALGGASDEAPGGASDEALGGASDEAPSGAPGGAPSGAPGGQLPQPRLLVNIGRAREVLLAGTMDQLRMVQKKLHFHYVYFHSLIEPQPETVRDSMFFGNYTYYQMFQSFRELGLIPYWHVDFSALEQTEASGSTQVFCRELSDLLDFLIRSFSEEEVRQWKIELACSDPADAEEFKQFYLEVSSLVAGRLNGTVGLQALFRNTAQERDLFVQVLLLAKERGQEPGFVSFSGAFDTERLYAGISEEAFRKLGGYHRQLTEQVQALTAQAGCRIDEIYMPEWNTLSSKTLIQSGTFFRSALILDTLLSLGNDISGIGFYLNTYAPTMLRRREDTSMLALFLFFQARRPVFFVLDALRRMGQDLLYRGQYVLATGNGGGGFNILVYYPCYVDPMYSLDDGYMEYVKKRFLIRLTGLKAGTYQFKCFTFDKDSAGIFRWWEKSGSSGVKDPDFIEYMNALGPDLFLYVQQIDGSYTLSPTLSFNGIILYQVKRI